MERDADPFFTRQGYYGRVLNDQGVGTGIGKLPDKFPYFRQFAFIYNGIDGSQDPHPEPVCVGAQPPDILHGIAGILPGSESWPCNIHGIGTAVNCRDADFRIPCGGKEFEFRHYLRTSSCCFAVAPYWGSSTSIL